VFHVEGLLNPLEYSVLCFGFLYAGTYVVYYHHHHHHHHHHHRHHYHHHHLLPLSFHSVAVVLTLVRNMNKYTSTKQYKNTVQIIQNTVNTSIRITKTPTQLSKHTLQNPYIHTPTYYKTHSWLCCPINIWDLHLF